MISLITILAAIGIVVGLVAGIYPSLYLSSVKPTAVLKGKFLQSPSRDLQSASGSSKQICWF
jgi:putative ABC transport system permease protein